MTKPYHHLWLTVVRYLVLLLWLHGCKGHDIEMPTPAKQATPLKKRLSAAEDAPHSSVREVAWQDDLDELSRLPRLYGGMEDGKEQFEAIREGQEEQAERIIDIAYINQQMLLRYFDVLRHEANVHATAAAQRFARILNAVNRRDAEASHLFLGSGLLLGAAAVVPIGIYLACRYSSSPQAAIQCRDLQGYTASSWGGAGEVLGTAAYLGSTGFKSALNGLGSLIPWAGASALTDSLSAGTTQLLTAVCNSQPTESPEAILKKLGNTTDAHDAQDTVARLVDVWEHQPLESGLQAHILHALGKLVSLDARLALKQLSWLEKVHQDAQDAGVRAAAQAALDAARQAIPQLTRARYEKDYGSIPKLDFVPGDVERPINSAYVRLAIVKRNKETKKDDQVPQNPEIIQAPKEPITLAQIPTLLKEQQGPKPRRAFLLGAAGTGKTTLCRKIAYSWAHDTWGKAFDAVYVLSIRKLNYWKEKTDLKHAIAEQCFDDGLDSEQLEERVSFVKRQLRENGDRVLLIFDGIDEANTETIKLLEQAQNKEGYSKTLQLWVSRPYGIEESERREALEIENQGFGPNEIERYVQQHFEQPAGEADGQALVTELLQHITQHPGMQDFARAPLNLRILCILWKDEATRSAVKASGSSMTRLYDLLTEKILGWFETKSNYQKVSVKISEVEEEYPVDQWRDKLLALLKRVAYAGLSQALTRQQLLDHTLLSEQAAQLIETSDSYSTQALGNLNRVKETQALVVLSHASGLLGKAENGTKSEFPHLTFQEYFAGRELARQLLKARREAIKFLQSSRYHPRYQLVLLFMAGALNEKSYSNLFEVLDTLPQEVVGLHDLLLKLRLKNEYMSLLEPNAQVSIQPHNVSLPDIAELYPWIQAGLASIRKDRDDTELHDTIVDFLGELRYLLTQSKVVEIYARACSTQEQNVGVRADAVEALGLLAKAVPKLALEVVPLLIYALKDTDKSVQINAAGSLGLVVKYNASVAPRVIPHLNNALKNNWTRGVAEGALESIEQAGKPGLAPQLRTQLRTFPINVPKATEASPGVIASLINALKNKEGVDYGATHNALGSCTTHHFIEVYCCNTAIRQGLLPYLFDRLYTQPLVIEGTQLTLYQNVGDSVVWKSGDLPEEGVKALQAALKAYKEAVLKAAQTDE